MNNKSSSLSYCRDCDYYYESSEDHQESFKTSLILKEKIAGEIRVRNYSSIISEERKNETDQDIGDRLIESHNKSIDLLDFADIVNNLNSKIHQLTEDLENIHRCN